MDQHLQDQFIICEQSRKLESIKAQVTSFNLFRGENSRLDLLLQNLEIILSKEANPNAECQDKSRSQSNAKEFLSLGKENHDFTTDEESSVTDEHEDHPIFAIELVMLKILNHLSDTQLKHCRLVSTNFNHFSTQIMLRRDSIRVNFKYHRARSEFVAKSLCDSPNNCFLQQYTLSSFTEFMQTRGKFPCNFFTFADGSLSAYDLQDFLSNQGRFIQRLSLDLYSPSMYMPKENNPSSPGPSLVQTHNQNQLSTAYPTIYLLKKLLVHQVPNLKQLNLNKSPIQWNTNTHRLFPEPRGMEIFLPNLTTLTLGFDVPDKIFGDLLKAGINLKEAISFQSINPLLSAHKLHLIRNLICEPNIEELELYESCLERLTQKSQPQSKIILEYLLFTSYRFPILPEMFTRLARVLENILAASSKTIRRLSFGSQLGHLPQLRIPRLTQVTSLRIASNYSPLNQICTQQLPRGFQFNRSFPHLNCITFDLKPLKGNEMWNDYFSENLDPIRTVRTLIFKRSMVLPSSWLGKFSTIFPFVETFECWCEHFNFPDAAAFGLWNFLRLRNLMFEINLNVTGNCYPALDAAFTGFSEETCIELQETSEHVDIKRVGALRGNPSIVDLKELRSLNLKFVDETSHVRNCYPPIWTHVTGLFAFRMCPRLEVKVEYSVSKANVQGLTNALSPVFPYIDSEYFGRSFDVC